MFLITILPVWAGDTCSMDVIKLEENVELIKEQAEVIAECKATMEALNKTMREQVEECKEGMKNLDKIILEQSNTIEALNRTVQEQGDECKNMIEALARATQEQETKINKNEAGIQAFDRSQGEFEKWGKIAEVFGCFVHLFQILC